MLTLSFSVSLSLQISYTIKKLSIYKICTYLYITSTDKEYAGHDITLAIGLMKTDEQWLDKFVQMEDKWVEDAKGWVEYMECKYPKCGILKDKFHNNDTLEPLNEPWKNWIELTKEEKEQLDKCIIM